MPVEVPEETGAVALDPPVAPGQRGQNRAQPGRAPQWGQSAVPQVKAVSTTTTLLPMGDAEDDYEPDEPVGERAPRRRRRRSWRPSVIAMAYQRLGTTLALVAALGVGIVLWYVGGNYTLGFVGSWDQSLLSAIEKAGWWAWVIPAGISVIEIFLYPQPERSVILTVIRAVLWLGILAFDVYSTYKGFTPWVHARGLTDPTLNQAAGVVFGFVCAFVPERILRWVAVEVHEMWVEPLFKRLGVRLVPVT